MIEISATELKNVPGGYVYNGASSYQICFPLKAGGELRFMICDDDAREDGSTGWHVDWYSGALPPGITGFAEKTSNQCDCRADFKECRCK